MKRVTFLLGLAGSGKSFLADRLKLISGARIFEGVAGVERSALLSAMVQHLQGDKDCIVEEIAYCDADNRHGVVAYLRSNVPDVTIEWICFANDLESANWNVLHRTNKGDAKGHLAINQEWHARYTYPSGASIRPITRIVDD